MSTGPQLTAEQERAAARRSGSLLLAAGAGSGKTAVLVERFARAVTQDGLAPGRILAISFTERAAAELRERVRARLLELGEREAARGAEAAFVSTFHGFCARLLRAHPLQAGIEPSFRVLEESFSSRLRRRAFATALGDFVAGEREAAVELVAAYGADPLRSIVLDAYAQLRSQGERAPRLPAPAARAGALGRAADRREQGTGADADDLRRERGALAACALIDELLDRFGAAYERLKRERGALDFDDLELLAGELLQRRSLREGWSQRFELLMVDEFQDTNQRQLRILAALDRDNLFTVGDELQSIYSFRHAEVGLFRERGERLAEDEAVLALTRNFRSRAPILAAVARIFGERMGRRFAQLAPTRDADPPAGPAVELLLSDRAAEAASAGTGESDAAVGETARSSAAATARIPLADLPAAPAWRQAEARQLAARIRELVEREGVLAGEVAVLLRALGDLPLYEAALRAEAIPTIAAAGGFWGHQQVGDLLAWLRCLANPLDELALYSVLASPLVGLSSDALALLAGFAREQGGGVWQAIEQGGTALDSLLRDGDRQRLAQARALLVAERRELALRPIADLLARAIAATGYERHVLGLEWGERRLASVHKLLRVARSFEAQEGRDLRGFLDHAAHVEEAFAGREADAAVAGAPDRGSIPHTGDTAGSPPIADRGGPRSAGRQSPGSPVAGQIDAVRLMSIHAAKGLEFPVVCVADLGREPNLRQGELLIESGGRIGLRLLDARSGEAAPTLAYEELCEERRRQQLEEEDRVLYVACTRARERLILSGAVAFERWPRLRPGCAPIAWLAPALVPEAVELARARRGESVTVPVQEGLDVRCRFDVPAAADRRANRHRERGRSSDCSPQAGGPPPTVSSPPAPGGSASRGPGPGAPPAPGGSAPPEPEPSASPAPGESVPPEPGPQAPTAPGEGKPPPGVGTPASQRPESPTRPRADPDATVSYTSLGELERCGYRYYLERVLRMPERHVSAHGPGLDARLRGTIVHSLLEEVDFAAPKPIEPAEVARVARGLGARLPARERAAIVQLLARALAAEPARRLGELPRGRREHPFAFSLGPAEPLIGGFVDLLVELPDGRALIVDYKSDRLDGEEDLEQLVQRDYALQRLVYALAALEGGAAEVEVAHWYLERPARWVCARFDAGERERLRGQLRQRLAAARERGYTVSERPHRDLCLTCPGRGGLCSWGETHTMRARSTTLAIAE